MMAKNKTPIGIRIAIIIGKVIFIVATLITMMVSCSDQMTISEVRDAGPICYFDGDYYDAKEIIEAFTAARNQALIVMLIFIIIVVALFVLGSMLKKRYAIKNGDIAIETSAQTATPAAKEAFVPEVWHEGTGRRAVLQQLWNENRIRQQEKM